MKTSPLPRILSILLVVALSGITEFAAAQTSQTPAAQEPPAAQSQQQPGASGTTVNPAQGPLEPVPAPEQQPLPNAPSTQAPAAQQAPAPAPQSQTEPLGTAAAPSVPSVGGGASKPAGMAIAPAKQRQYRSLFVKIGLIAGAGIALGTVYALSRGTSSTPPNSGR